MKASVFDETPFFDTQVELSNNRELWGKTI